MDRDKEYYLKKLDLLLSRHNYDLNSIVFEYGGEVELAEVAYALWEGGILDIKWKEEQLELNFE